MIFLEFFLIFIGPFLLEFSFGIFFWNSFWKSLWNFFLNFSEKIQKQPHPPARLPGTPLPTTASHPPNQGGDVQPPCQNMRPPGETRMATSPPISSTPQGANVSGTALKMVVPGNRPRVLPAPLPSSRSPTPPLSQPSSQGRPIFRVVGEAIVPPPPPPRGL